MTNLLGGIVAQKLGVKWVHFGGMAVATVATVLCPVSGQASEWGLMAMRIQAFREFIVSLALISNLNGHKSVELSHVKCKILTYCMISFICSL